MYIYILIDFFFQFDSFKVISFFWLRWILVTSAASFSWLVSFSNRLSFSSCAIRGRALAALRRLLVAATPLVAEHRL